MYALVAKITRATVPKAAVPKRDEKPIHGLVSDKNFIVANAVENILAGKCAHPIGSRSRPLQLFGVHNFEFQSLFSPAEASKMSECTPAYHTDF